MHAAWFVLPLVIVCAAHAEENDAQRLTRTSHPSERDLSKGPTLYAVGYAHLDTQWRWDFPLTIDEYIRATLDDNFARFEAFPEYTFSFTGSVRYEMMKEYYPQRYEVLRKYIDADRWFVSGSSVDEGDVNVPSPESIIRQVLYGNLFFRREFGRESVDFMLPDCFGFPASLPTLWSHCGLLGFSTQKLTWGSAVGIPFTIGVWEGPDGNGVIAALDPGAYVGAIDGRVDRNERWAERINDNGEMFGIFADYHYYGVGDIGGAPREKDVRNYTASIDNPDSLFLVNLAASDRMYKDITPKQRARMPRYVGDMLLTEHSAGTLTSQSYMKRWNRAAEQLADAAERAAVAAHLLGGQTYPREQLERGWIRLLANQMHDILPGTSIPRAYTWSWNDEVLAMNLFATVLTDAVGSWSRALDTNTIGTPLLVYNALARERSGLVEATVPMTGVQHVRVHGPDGRETASQMLERTPDSVRILFHATVPSVGLTVYDVRPSDTPFTRPDTSLTAGRRGISTASRSVRLNAQGDIEQVTIGGQPLLRAPHRLVFTHESPREYPAWNMDWDDRRRPPLGHVDGEPTITVLESGPLRAAIHVVREARGSIFEQTISLTEGAGEQDALVQIDSTIDWQSAGVALKASFPLAVSNPVARYNWGISTILRGTNDPKKYEVPSHEWFSLTDVESGRGVTILEDSKFGSDKPSDHELRLTLLYSPEVRSSYQDQHSQDWGIHEMSYAIAPISDPVDSDRAGRAFNQPLRVFTTSKHDGPLGRSHSLLRIDVTKPIDIRAIKLAEERDAVIIRAHELAGQEPVTFDVAFDPTVQSRLGNATRVDGQERALAKAFMRPNGFRATTGAYSISSHAIDVLRARMTLRPVPSKAVPLPYNRDVVSFDGDRTNGAVDDHGRTYPAELLPSTITSRGITFELGSTADDTPNAVECREQTIALPPRRGAVHLLLAADSADDVRATFRFGLDARTITVQPWTGFIGQWDDRVWDAEQPATFFSWDGRVTDIRPAFIRRDPVAWFASHRHHPTEGNEAYRFSYLFHKVLTIPAGATSMTLPDDPRVLLLAMTCAPPPRAHPAAPLYDTFSADRHIEFRYTYPPEPVPPHTGLVATGRVLMERTESVEATSLATPTAHDIGARAVFRAFDPQGNLTPHSGSGLTADGHLPRLNDGAVAQNNDDTSRSVWYDQEGRFIATLPAPTTLERIDTFSWHVSNRAPQAFSVWGSNAAEPGEASFEHGAHGDWTLLGVVDTRSLGDGGVHVSSILPRSDEPLGTFRHLLWIAEDMGQGTFFMEIDLHEAPR